MNRTTTLVLGVGVLGAGLWWWTRKTAPSIPSTYVAPTTPPQYPSPTETTEYPDPPASQTQTPPPITMDAVCSVSDREGFNQWVSSGGGSSFGYAQQGAGQLQTIVDQLITGAKVKAGCFPTTS
jgi:hypothetical protein